MKPLTSERNLTPSSTALGSATDGFPGTLELLQPPHGQAGPAAMVKDQTRLAARALPAASLTWGSLAPPLTVAV